MISLRIIYRGCIVLLFLSVNVYAQDSLRVDSLLTVTPDTVSIDTQKQTSKPLEKIDPWVFSRSIGYREATNDSLLRWQVWPSWGDWYSRREDVISYRQGTVGRVDAFLIDGIEPRFQSLSWNGIRFNDPVSGAINLNEIPHHKLSSVTQNKGIGHESEVFFKNYYITKPVTQLNFDESKFEYRNLEFVFSRNFTPKTNVELSFWDRRDGDAFRRSDVQGSQAFGRILHHFNNKWLLQVGYLRNQYNREESFGYQLPTNLASFNFNRFTTQPIVNNGNSEPLTSIWSASLHKRTGDAEDSFSVGIHRKRIDNELTYTSDTTFYDIKNIGLRADKKIDMGFLDFQFAGDINHYDAPDTSSIALSSWTEWSGKARAAISLSESISINGFLEARGRDDQSVLQFGARTHITPVKNVSLNIDGAIGNHLPTVQQLFWRSRLFSGDANLNNEEITTAGAEIVYGGYPGFELGARGRLRKIDNGVLLGIDSTFTNVSSYESFSGTVFGSYNVKHWEGSVSGTVTQFSSSGSEEINQRINALQPSVLIKGSAYIKGTIYNGATFVKAGFAGTFSPNITETYTYVPDLGNWRLISDNQRNLSYFRLDFDFSARLRSIFIVMRWENILDGLAQPGYFESVGYPLPPRRFVTGIRVLFRN